MFDQYCIYCNIQYIEEKITLAWYECMCGESIQLKLILRFIVKTKMLLNYLLNWLSFTKQ